MGPKARGNFQVNWCSRIECLNRDKECAYCFHFSDYKPPKEIEEQTKPEKD